MSEVKIDERARIRAENKLPMMSLESSRQGSQATVNSVVPGGRVWELDGGEEHGQRRVLD